MTVLADCPLHELSMEAVAEAAGVGKPVLYTAFRTRTELVNAKKTVAVRLAPDSGAVTGDPEVIRDNVRGHAWALQLSPDGNVWGATVNKTAGDAERLDDVVFPLFPQGGGFPRGDADKT